MDDGHTCMGREQHLEAPNSLQRHKTGRQTDWEIGRHFADTYIRKGTLRGPKVMPACPMLLTKVPCRLRLCSCRGMENAHTDWRQKAGKVGDKQGRKRLGDGMPAWVHGSLLG